MDTESASETLCFINQNKAMEKMYNVWVSLNYLLL
jgi:hypothetical protein